MIVIGCSVSFYLGAKINESSWQKKEASRLAEQNKANQAQNRTDINLVEKQAAAQAESKEIVERIKERIRVETVTETVYLNTCLSDNGLLEYNRLVDKANSTNKRNATLSTAPASSK